MLNITAIIEKILQSSYMEKNAFIPIGIFIVIILTVLKIDIETIKNLEYSVPVLIIINIVLTFFVLPVINSKFKKFKDNITDIKSMEDNLTQLLEKFYIVTEDIQYVKKTVSKVEKVVKDTNIGMKGIPNLKILHNILTLKTSELWADIFKQYLQTLVLHKLDNNKIAIENLNSNVKDIVKVYLEFIKEILIQHQANYSIIDELETISKTWIVTINIEIEKAKKIDEKLFTISSMLKYMCEDIDKQIVVFLQKFQLAVY